MKVTLTIIASIAAGVCIGLLIAPDKGSETRKKLADSASDGVEKLKNVFGAGEAQASDSTSKSQQPTPQTF